MLLGSTGSLSPLLVGTTAPGLVSSGFWALNCAEAQLRDSSMPSVASLTDFSCAADVGGEPGTGADKVGCGLQTPEAEGYWHDAGPHIRHGSAVG